MPLSFEPNRGQTSDAVQWVARGPEYALFLSGHDAVLELNSIAAKAGTTGRPKIESAAVRMNLLGAQAVKAAEGEEAQAGKANYFTGRDASKWLSEVPMFGRVRLREVYPGIDLVYYGRQGRLEYDFVVAPGADPGRIALGFEGATARVAANGDLVLPIEGEGESLRPTSQNRDFGMGHPSVLAPAFRPEGESLRPTSQNRDFGMGHPSILPTEIRFDKPVVYQMKGGVREPVAGGFRVAADGRVSFALGSYDKTRELVIDPTLVFEGEIGTGNQQTIPTGMAVDSLGEMVITGYTNDLTFPTTTGALQTNCQTYSAAAAANGFVRCGPSSSPSAFVTKLSADGASLIYSTYLHGGGGYEQGQSVVVDAAGDAYVLGSTSSNDFPITSNAYQTYCQPAHPFLGFNYPNYGPSVSSQCDNFANGGGTEYTVNGPNLFIAKLNPLGTALLYSTFFGGTQGAYPVGLALDSAGNMYFMSNVIGLPSDNLYVNNQNSYEVQFPVTDSAYQGVGIGVNEVAVSELSADGQTLLYSTFLGAISGGSGHNVNGQAFALGPNGIAYAGGYTQAINFPTTAGSFKPTCTVYANDNSYCQTNMGFVTAIDTTKSGAASLVYSSYLGGETTQGSNIPEQEVYGLAADANNDLFVTGYTSAVNFPTTAGAFQTSCPVQGNIGSCPETGFLTKINPTGSALTWSTFVGGTSTSPAPAYGSAIALGGTGQVYLYGFSQDGGGDFPQVNPLQSYTGGNKVFVTEFTADGKTELFGTRFGTSSTTTGSGTTPIANGIAVDAAGNMYITGYTNDGGTFGTTTGTYSTPATNGFNRTFFAKISPNTPPVPNNGLTTNLLLNPGAELGSIADWTAGGNGTPQVDTGTFDPGISPHTGNYDFVGGPNSNTDSLSQTVSIIQQGITAAQVDGGTLFANVSFWEQGLNQGDPSDSGSVTLTFLDTDGATLGTVTIGPEDSHSGSWFNVTGVPAIPVGTRSITYTMNFIKNQLSDNDAFIDDNVLSIHTNTGLTISPSTLHFGNVAVGSLSPSQTATVTNNQTTAITIDQIVSELGANPAEFGVSTYCPQGSSLAAGASCPVTITFAPVGVGAKSAGIAIQTESVPPLQQIAVDGTGTGGILQVNPGNLKTIAGNGTAGYTGDLGLATAAELIQPNGMAFDPAGNFYIADTEANVVRKVDTTGKITTFAGDGTGGFAGDGGPATQAELLIPFSVASDKNGNIFIQDTGNSVIRRVDTTGKISTVAGTPGVYGRSGDGGPATAAKLNENQGARFDSAGNFYLAVCPTGTVRKIDLTGVITTVAGTPGTPGFSGDGGPATAAELQCPSGVAIDAAGNLYIADEFNEVIRKVTAATGLISTIAGTPGVAGYSGDGGAATAARFNDPNDVVVDSAGNLYVADSANNRVRKIDTNGTITTVAGGVNDAGSAAVNTPLSVTVDPAGNVYFSDSGNSAVREIFPEGVTPFPATAVGATAPPQTVTISNIGNVDVAIPAAGGFATSGNAGDFALTGGTCLTGATLTANGGSCTLTISFTPTAAGQRSLTVSIADNALNSPQSFVIGGTGTSLAAMPVITWATPAAITTATPLSGTQLDATATDVNGVAVPGAFVYTPAAGTLLSAGTQTLSVTFTPTDLTAFTTATKTVQILVTQAPPATLTTLTVTSGGEAVTTVASGTAVTLTASVTSGGNSVSPGQVAFCDATAARCTDSHLLGTAQLVGGDSTSTATYKFVPGIGAHSYKAVFLGTKVASGSASVPAALAVTGLYPTTTAIAQSGTAGSYQLTATVTGIGNPTLAPTGTVSFLDSSNANAVAGTGALGAGTAGLSFADQSSTANVENPQTRSAVADFNGDGILDVATASTAPDPTPTIYANSVTISLGNGDGTFNALGSRPATGNRPQSIVAGDFNGDGKADLAVTNISDGTVTILLGHGDGTFTAAATAQAAQNAYGLVTGDFNGDGNLDIAVSTLNGIAVLLGNGDGTFVSSQITLPSASNEAYGPIATADFNGDGKADLVVEGYSPTGELVVLLGNGDGSFATEPAVALTGQGSNLNGIVTGDFNGDGKPDVAATNSSQNTVLIMLGNGDGTFATTAAAAATFYDPADLQTGDFDGDGKLDLVVMHLGGSHEDVLLGNGDGTFTTAGISTGVYAYNAITVGDFNGDGVPDVAATDGSTNLEIALTQRTQTASVAATPVAALGAGTHQVVASFPGDANYSASVSQATALTGAGTPITPTITWAMPAPITTATPLSSTQLDATATDVNGVAVPGTFVYTPAAGTLLSAGTQTLSATFTPTDLTAFTTATKTVQILVTQAVAATVTTLTVTSGGEAATTVAAGTVVTLTATVTAGGVAVSPGQVVFCDASAGACAADHRLGPAQLAGTGTAAGTATYRYIPGIGLHAYKALFLGTTSASGSISEDVATLVVTGKNPTATTIAQSGTAGNYTLTATVVGTGSAVTGPTGVVSFVDTTNANAVLGTNALGDSAAGFALAAAGGSPVKVGGGPYGMATGDFNGDGLTDLVVENYESATVSVLLGKGDGTFQPQVTYAVGRLPERVLVADLDGDGNLDLVVANTGSNTIGVLLGKGDGTFQAQVTYACGSPVGLGVMDINHDGIPDVVAGDYYSNSMSVLLGNGDGTLKPAVTYATGGTPQTVAEGDFNGDGNVDVAVGNFGGATVGVFLGNGDGTFAAMVTYPVGRQPQGVQVGDFNSDGKEDLAVSNSGDGTVGVLLGNGDGTFAAMVTYPVGVQPVGIAIADFNGDGIEDITVGNTGQASLTQSVLLGKGDGTFASQATFATGNFPYGTTTGDFNGDGLPDMAVANYNDGTATIFLSQVTATAVATVTGVSPAGAGAHLVVASYPGDANFAASMSQTTTLTVAIPLALTSFTPVGAVAGSGDTKITLTGTGFGTASVVMVNGAGVATAYVSATTLTAVIPAALLKTTGTLAVTVEDTSLDAMTAAQNFAVVPAAGAATLTGPTTTPPASQPTVTLSITNPYPLALTAQFTLTFAGAASVDDPSIQFSTGGRMYSYPVAANSTSVPPVQLQAGTDAGTITIAAKLLAAGVDVTPAGLAPLVIVVPAVVPVISGTTITAAGKTLTVVVHGFSNTREVSQAVFEFTAATGDTLATPMVTIPATTLFNGWFAGDPSSIAYGSTFTYTQVFTTSEDAKTVGSVKVTLTNSVGVSEVSSSP